MAGKKGRSGRQLKYVDGGKVDLAARGYRMLLAELDDPEVSRRDKLDRLEPFLLKLVPQMVEVSGANLDAKTIADLAEAGRILGELEAKRLEAQRASNGQPGSF